MSNFHMLMPPPHLSGWFWLLPQNFVPVVRTHECHLLFCECRWGGSSTSRWWTHLNTTCCNWTCLNFVHWEVVGIQKPSFAHFHTSEPIAPKKSMNIVIMWGKSIIFYPAFKEVTAMCLMLVWRTWDRCEGHKGARHGQKWWKGTRHQCKTWAQRVNGCKGMRHGCKGWKGRMAQDMDMKCTQVIGQKHLCPHTLSPFCPSCLHSFHVQWEIWWNFHHLIFVE